MATEIGFGIIGGGMIGAVQAAAIQQRGNDDTKLSPVCAILFG